MNDVKTIPVVSKVELCYFRNSNDRHLHTNSNNNMYENNDDYSFNSMLLDEIDRLRSSGIHI
jgi:hypothetical protein